jgi:hypothetical protein
MINMTSEHYGPDTLDRIINGYITTALWAETDQSDPDTGGEPLNDNYGPGDLSEDFMRQAREDCAAMADTADLKTYLQYQDAFSFGHDFWLTRNGHGAGFWDRWHDGGELEALGRRLTDMAKPFGEVNLYVGEDGKIHA